jgi:pyruvate formate lyase activating enzyme
LQELLSAGLVDYVAMDIKSAPDTYAKAVGLEAPDIEAVKKSVTIIKNSGVAHEFRTTFVKGLHNASDLAKIGDWLRGEEHYYLQMFVDSGELVGASDVIGGFSAFSKEEMAEITKCLDGKVGYSVRGL